MLPDLHLPAPDLAPLLLGCELSRRGRPGLRAQICEVEAYQGGDDRGCHACKGRTPRTDTLWAEAGTLYCYLCYGIHCLINIVCQDRATPAAVLLRGIRIADEDLRRLNGPGKLSARLDLDCRANGSRLGQTTCPLVLHPRPEPLSPARISCGPRVGIAYAGPDWANRPWRFWLDDYPVRRQPAYS